MGNNRKQTKGRRTARPVAARKYQLGNFFVRDKEGRVEATDLTGQWKLTAGKVSPCGINIAVLCSNSPDTADIYLKMLWALCNCIPDEQFLKDLWQAYQARLARLPKEPELTEEDEIEQVRQMEAFTGMSESEMKEELEQIETGGGGDAESEAQIQ